MEQALLSVERRLMKVEADHGASDAIEERILAVEHRLAQLASNFELRWKDMAKVANGVTVEVEQDIARARHWRETQTESQDNIGGDRALLLALQKAVTEIRERSNEMALDIFDLQHMSAKPYSRDRPITRIPF